jgi:ATP-dependent exoDNAse (exonuclease V) alpha subunit
MVALRRRDVTELNIRARALLVQDGTVEPDGVTFAGHTFAVGDDIVCLRNDRRVGVHNALFATVTAVDPQHGLLVQRKDTDNLQVVPAEYLRNGHVDHAYAMTIHKAQGTTVQHTLVLADDALHRQGAYTALSRGRISNDIYIPEDSTPAEHLEPHGTHDGDAPSDALLRALGRDAAKELAIDIIE